MQLKDANILMIHEQRKQWKRPVVFPFARQPESTAPHQSFPLITATQRF